MIFDRQRQRVERLGVQVARDQARMRSGWSELLARTRRRAGTPMGLAICFGAGLIAAPLLGTAGRVARRSVASGPGLRSLAAGGLWVYQSFFRDSEPTPGETADPGAEQN